MFEPLLIVGVACMIAAIVGGGLKLMSVQLPLVSSVARQVMLGSLGGVLTVASFLVPQGDKKPAETKSASPAVEKAEATRAPVEESDPPIQDPTAAPAGEPNITLTPNSGRAGSDVTIAGSGFDRGPITVFFTEEEEVDYENVTSAGTFRSEFPVPRLPPGSYLVIAREDLSKREARTSFTIVS